MLMPLAVILTRWKWKLSNCCPDNYLTKAYIIRVLFKLVFFQRSLTSDILSFKETLVKALFSHESRITDVEGWKGPWEIIFSIPLQRDRILVCHDLLLRDVCLIGCSKAFSFTYSLSSQFLPIAHLPSVTHLALLCWKLNYIVSVF